MRDWIVSNIGLPHVNQGRVALRTPATWAGIIEAPLLLMGTDSAAPGRAQQLDGLTAVLRDLDRPFEHDVAVGELSVEAARRVANFLLASLTAQTETNVDVAEASTPDAI
jgi:hypothetical protein